MKTQRLSPKDWMKAGFTALHKGGPQAIKVEAIAKTLKVSKGSFYWHFKDARHLKVSMLEHWEQVTTTATIELINSSAETKTDRLSHLIAVTSRSLKGANQNATLNEAAIRDWARYDTDVASVVKNVDQKRLNYVAEGFIDVGFNNDAAHQKARLLYAAVIGFEHADYSAHEYITPDLQALLSLLLAAKSD